MTSRLRRDEQGFTLIELLVATAMGMVVIMIISMLTIATLHQSSRIQGRVDATQRARIVTYQIMDELHSACIAPQIAPIQAGSSGTSLNFIHQRGITVAPTPVLSKITLTGTTLTESNFANTGGTAPGWTFATTASSTRTLMTNVTATAVPVFRYYAYSSGAVSATPLTVPLSTSDAARTVQVTVTMAVAPGTTSVVDANAAASVQDTAFLRFTPPNFSSTATNLPCQ